MRGTISAIFNGGLQLGPAVIRAAFNSIESSVEEKTGGTAFYTGRAAAIWFVLALVCVEAVSLLVFYRVDVERDIDSLSAVGTVTTSEKLEEVKENTNGGKLGVDVQVQVAIMDV
ncbi:hypothetical protein NLI96_g9025 [Meripilus lineatus]|uniref:Uncharacterized protein n=1 Tax=Meripilus lineatus TaxID=2056292 RepID=A0AAD5V1H5_9APHY|nr:hypothetical protein NLI96_g9025 [Physisporinus lineatus]